MSAPPVKRRKLRFTTSDECVAEVDRLAAAEVAGTLRRNGQWTLGQAVNHVAAWAEYALAPPTLPKPFLLFRLFGRVARRVVLNRGMPTGIRLNGVPGGTLATEVVPTDAARERLQQAFGRLDRDTPAAPSPLFGPMTHADWKRLQHRHAELHLGFFDA